MDNKKGQKNNNKKYENFRCPGRAWFLLLPSENVHWKCKCASHRYIIKITLLKLAEATRETEHRSAMHSAPNTEV